MTKQLEGKKAPNFKGSCTSNKEIKLSDFKGENLVLYFYPKDSTPRSAIFRVEVQNKIFAFKVRKFYFFIACTAAFKIWSFFSF